MATDDTTALAGHGRRLAATALDTVTFVVVAGACGGAGFLAGLAGAASAGDNDDGWEELGWILLGTFVGAVVGVVVGLVLAVWLVRRPGRRNGQSLGKQAVGIRAVRADRAEIGLGLALLRELAAKWLLIWIVALLISGFMGFADGGLVGLLVAIVVWYAPVLFDGERRALHDRMCSTRVVVASPPPAPAGSASDDLWPATPETPGVGEDYTLGGRPHAADGG